MTSQAMDKVTGREESSSSTWMEPYLEKFELEVSMQRKFEDEETLYRNELSEKMTDAPFKPEKFGDPDSLMQISGSLLRHGVVSIALFNDKVMIYACSGTAVRHWHGNIQGHHNIFVTSARLARKFEDNRTRDDNLRIEVCTSDNEILHGWLGLYDDNIAIVTSFSLEIVYNMDTCKGVRLPRGTFSSKVFAFGCANDGTLMGAKCSHPVINEKGLVSVNCKITESGLGGPVMYFAPGGSGKIVGLIIGSFEGKITLLPRRELHEWLKRLLLITSKTSHFRENSLPEGVRTAIPSGFMVPSKILQSLGYPLPPPLVFELNGRLVGRYEEFFGQLHYWDGYPFDYPYCYGGEKLIWKEFGKDVVEKISQSVVSIASFKDKTRCFACTGLLITGRDYPLVLTSASLVRTNDADGKIDENLRIQVFLPPNSSVEGKLQLYDDTYNIAVFSLKDHLTTDISPQDIFSSIPSPSPNGSNYKSVVAIGRSTERSHGVLMASMGEVQGKYEAFSKHENKPSAGLAKNKPSTGLAKNKPSTGLAKKLDCKDLLWSTCQIKKVAIGGPLVRLDGSFIGMNFYDESGTTPFLPRDEILTVLQDGINLLGSSTVVPPVKIDSLPGLYLSPKTRKRKRNQWPVPKPYWSLGGQVPPVQQLVGKTLM